MAKILCIDDDMDIIESCKIILKEDGHQVEGAINGELGLKKAKEFKPDLILLDVMMSHASEGFHVAYEIRKDPELKFKPILMLTSVNQKTGNKFDPNKDGEFLPVDEFIEKPVDRNKILPAVKRLLATPKEQINVEGRRR